MKKQVAVVALIFVTLNFGASNPSTAVINTPKQKTINLTEDLLLASKKSRLPKVVKYLTTKANKTAYVFSGSNTYGWDCSGMVRWTYKQIGITLPHSADKQAHLGKRVSKPVIGDIVVFAYKNSTEFYHSAIYLGQGLIINANREYGTTVIEPLSNFSKSQIRFIRVLN